MKNTLDHIATSFREYYETEFNSEAEDSNFNRKIRIEAISALKKALEDDNTELAVSILNLISENTGCEEDLSLFNELTSPLESVGLLTESQVNIVTKSKGLKRWQ
jgi:hypothetical protein